MTNYEKLKQGDESIDDVILRLLRDGKVCNRFCAVPVKRSTLCVGYKCADRVRIFLEREVGKNG